MKKVDEYLQKENKYVIQSLVHKNNNRTRQLIESNVTFADYGALKHFATIK